MDTPLELDCLTDPRDLPALAPTWQRLLDLRTPGAVFRSPAWLVPWWKWFSAGKALHVLLARRQGQLVGLLPAYRIPTPLGGTRLRLLGDGVVGSDYLGPIARPDELADVCRLFAAHIAHTQHDAWLERLDVEDPLTAALEQMAGMAVTRRNAIPCPYIVLRGSYAAWSDTLPKGFGTQIRRRHRWLKARPGFRIEVVGPTAAPSQVEQAMDTLFALHRARWAAAGGSDGITGPRSEAFHRDAALALAPAGMLRLYLLHVEGAVRAALYGVICGPRFSFYQSGYEPAWQRRSPGTVLLAAAIEDAFTSGLEEFDLLHGAEPYKACFASHQRWLTDLRVASGARARVLLTAERTAAASRRRIKAMLPERGVSWFQRLRRTRSAAREADVSCSGDR